MKIKTRLSFQFTFLVGVILFFFSVLVYYFSYSSQRTKFREDLFDRAKNTAVLLINLTEIDSSLLKKIHQTTISWKNEEIAITDSAFKIIYSNNIKYLTGHILTENASKSNVKFFSLNEKDGVFYRHRLNNRTFNVYVMAIDSARTENLTELREILFWSTLFSILLSIFFSYLFSRKAIQPITKIINSVKAINASKLSARINEGNKKDEIEQLAMTFNEMLTNLEIVFKSQEEFVSNASHELRTPLAIMISEADFLLSHQRSANEYAEHITKMINDLKRLNSLSNSLLELAQLYRDDNILMTSVRVDEILYNSILQIKNNYPDRKLVSKIKYSENENDLIINGNSGMLEIAFKNLIDNACKFSSDEVIIEIKITDQFIAIRISDKGIGIPQTEIDSIFSPFKRATNVKYINGFGIGLSLVKKVLKLHKSEIEIISSENNGTQVDLKFKKGHLQQDSGT